MTKIKTDASTIGSEVAINEGSCLVTFSKKTLIVKKNNSNNKKQLVALEWPHVKYNQYKRNLLRFVLQTYYKPVVFFINGTDHSSAHYVNDKCS